MIDLPLRRYAFLALVALQEFSLRMTIYDGLVLGVVLILVIFAFPGGVTGTVASLVRRVRAARRADSWRGGR